MHPSPLSLIYHYLSIYLYLSIYIYLSIYLSSIYLSIIYLSIHPSIYLLSGIYLSSCLSITSLMGSVYPQGKRAGFSGEMGWGCCHRHLPPLLRVSHLSLHQLRHWCPEFTVDQILSASGFGLHSTSAFGSLLQVPVNKNKWNGKCPKTSCWTLKLLIQGAAPVTLDLGGWGEKAHIGPQFQLDPT